MKPEEKLLICLSCENFVNEKCKFAKCSACWSAIISAKYGKCPKDKWALPELIIN